MIDISNVVNVDFKIVKSEQVIGSYGTMVYFIPFKMTVDGETKKAVLCESQEDVENITFVNDSDEEIVYNTRQYFSNGGVKLLIMTANSSEDLESTYKLANFKSDIEYARTITNDFIFVTINNTICDVASNGYTTAVLGEIVSWFETLKSPQTLRLLLTKNIGTNNENPDYTYIDKYTDYSVGVKACSKQRNGKVVDAALLIGAYFTSIDLDNYETIKDYCYTPEKILAESTVTDDDTGISNTTTTNIASEDVTQSKYSKLVARNYNFIDTIGGKIINFGGNYANGISISTDFATICAENDVCSATLNSIMQKQYLNEQGLTNIISTIHKQLQRYKTNGYLNTNSQYSGDDLYLTYNGKRYSVIKNGAVLVNGYSIFAIPVSDISLEDKEEKRFPPIYVVMETLAGARLVTIQGEVR